MSGWEVADARTGFSLCRSKPHPSLPGCTKAEELEGENCRAERGLLGGIPALVQIRKLKPEAGGKCLSVSGLEPRPGAFSLL